MVFQKRCLPMKVLLATDGSASSESAASFLSRMAWSPDDAITVFHAVYAIPFHYDEKFYWTTLQSIKKECAPRVIDSAVEILKPVRAGISVEIEEGTLHPCTPEQCIIKAAEASGTDLIVMGASGRKGIASVFIGSVSRAVVNNATKPVLVVKQQAPRPSDRMRVLFAADGSDHSRATAELLTSLPFPDATELTIVHVIPSNFLDVPERFVPEVDERVKDAVANIRSREFTEAEKIIEQARGYLGRKFKQIHVLSKVGDPPTEILKAGEGMEADLIAVGRQGARGVRGALESVSRNILNHAACSVLIGR
jgi:nucleotide-binding universal stress UspA family protein